LNNPVDTMNQQEIILNFEHYPIVPVKFKNKDKKTPVIESLLDSGGDFIVLPYPIASFLELDLEPACDVDTAGGTTSLYRTTIDMAIGLKNKCSVYRNQEIHVSSREDIPVLLGRTPIFEDYEITFKKYKNQLIMSSSFREIHEKYPDDFLH
jgi:hypothetical protein